MPKTDSAKRSEMFDLLQKEELTSSETATLLRISVMEVTRLFKEGKLKGWRKTGAVNSPILVYTSSAVEFAEKVQGRSVAVQSKRSSR
ncbi:MAG: hypothetical protein WCF84_09270 [Anaerolineae bacterium]